VIRNAIDFMRAIGIMIECGLLLPIMLLEALAWRAQVRFDRRLEKAQSIVRKLMGRLK